MNEILQHEEMKFINPLRLIFGLKKGLVVGASVSTDSYRAKAPGYKVKISYPEHSTYIIGSKGTGKSTLMLNLLLQDIERNDKALVLLDPHGDLAEEVIERCPPSHSSRVSYFAPALKEQKQKPLGLNPFQLEYERQFGYKFDAIMKVFEHSWSLSYNRAPIMQNTLETITRVLLRAYKTTEPVTFLHFFLMLRRDEVGNFWRQHLTRSLSSNPAISYNLEQWQQQKKFEVATESSVTKANHIIADEILLNVLAQSKSAECFNFQSLTSRRGILIVNLKGLDDEGQRLLGSIVLTQLVAAAKDTEANSKRGLCHIYADEFYKFSSESFVEIINECRKFGLAVTIAHQALTQLDEEARSAAQSCGNIICYRVHPRDGKELSHHFKEWDDEIFHELKPFRALAKVILQRKAPESSIVKVGKPLGERNEHVKASIITRSLEMGTPLIEIQKSIKQLSPSRAEFLEALKIVTSDTSNEASKVNTKEASAETPRGRRASRFADKFKEKHEEVPPKSQ